MNKIVKSQKQLVRKSRFRVEWSITSTSTEWEAFLENGIWQMGHKFGKWCITLSCNSLLNCKVAIFYWNWTAFSLQIISASQFCARHKIWWNWPLWWWRHLFISFFGVTLNLLLVQVQLLVELGFHTDQLFLQQNSSLSLFIFSIQKQKSMNEKVIKQYNLSSFNCVSKEDKPNDQFHILYRDIVA